MPVRWSVLKVKEATDIIEEHLTNAETPLQLAREEVLKAVRLPNLPQYMEQSLRGLDNDIQNYRSRLNTRIRSIRDDLPKDQLAHEERMKDQGETQPLV